MGRVYSASINERKRSKSWERCRVKARSDPSPVPRRRLGFPLWINLIVCGLSFFRKPLGRVKLQTTDRAQSAIVLHPGYSACEMRRNEAGHSVLAHLSSTVQSSNFSLWPALGALCGLFGTSVSVRDGRGGVRGGVFTLLLSLPWRAVIMSCAVNSEFR